MPLKKFKVLIIDLDPQSNAGYVLGTDPTAPGTVELLQGKQPTPIQASENLYVLPGGPNLTGHSIQSLDPLDLSDAVEPLQFDVVIFDCPPGVEYLERLGLVAADVALICTDAHPPCGNGSEPCYSRLTSTTTEKNVRVLQD
ncbi:ParA family protein [Acaryochloris sp. 'Moss Beach']|uniref:ParA family protein n=1 Tax=Acaryochloris sp. 'Moss Beach' TaxID=2740837 RepID=UPI002714857F|nr:ParA family protein [Acaryochloris sp. 'Moss Beach']